MYFIFNELHRLTNSRPSASIKNFLFFDTFPFLPRRNTEKIRVKTIENEPNISRHKNGNLYYVARKKGKLIVKSLKTADLAEAKRKIRETGTLALTARREPELPAVVLPVPSPGALVEVAPAVPVALVAPPAPALTLAEALAEHDRGLVLLTKGTKEMAKRGRKAIERFATTGWVGFSPVAIWNAYRETGLERHSALLSSAANHLLWYMLKFVPWAEKRGFLGEDATESLSGIPRLKVNPRQIRVPAVTVVAEFLAMVESEDAEGGAFVRFLAVTGLRLSGALKLEWSDIDLGQGTMAVIQKGSWKIVIPMTPEAVELVTDRRGRCRPCPLDINALERVERRIKRFAKGFDIDLKTFHSFRHYFASRCLLSGMTVQEVAKLLGHSDQGQLVLKTYGHLCGEHLRQSVAKVRLAS